MRQLAFVVVVIGTIVAATGAAPATESSNSDLLVSAAPEIETVLTSTPDVIRLGFLEPIHPDTAVVQVFASSGDPMLVGPAIVDGSNLESSIELLADDRYLVAWSVEGADTGPASGGYFFTIDATGLGAVGVDRQVEGATGIRGGLRSPAAAVALAAGALLVAALTVTAVDPQARASGIVAPAVAVAAGAALITLATYVLPPGQSVGSLVKPEWWWAGVNSTPGRAWAAVLLSLGVVPLIVLLQRGDTSAPRRTPWRLGAGFVAVVTLVGVSIGVGALVNPGSAPVALAFLVAVGGVVAWFQHQRLIAIFAVAGFVTVALVSLYATLPAGHSDVVEAEGLILEIDIEPAARGTNEVHLYGFESGGGLAVLSESEAWITHAGTGVGPIRVPLVRAGPNHFLTYTADLPIAGEWRVEFTTGRPDGDESRVDTIVSIR